MKMFINFIINVHVFYEQNIIYLTICLNLHTFASKEIIVIKTVYVCGRGCFHGNRIQVNVEAII